MLGRLNANVQRSHNDSSDYTLLSCWNDSVFFILSKVCINFQRPGISFLQSHVTFERFTCYQKQYYDWTIREIECATMYTMYVRTLYGKICKLSKIKKKV